MKPAELVEPDTLEKGGRKFWDQAMEDHESLTQTQIRNLFEACRVMDTLDQLARDSKHSALLEAVETKDGIVEIRVDRAVAARKGLADMQAKLLASCRLDTHGARKAGNPGAARGAYTQQATAKSAAEVRAQMRSVG